MLNMNRKHILVGLLVVSALTLGLGATLYTGVGPAPGGTSGDSITDFPTPEESDNGHSEADVSAESAPFSFTVEEVTECGMTCRDVTATLHNNQNETATGVTVFTRIFAREDNTDMNDLVWEGTVEVGTLASGDGHTSTQRIELSIRDARKVDRHDGWITILTAVQTDERTVTFQDSEQVT